jgi:quercetin dioxygenase-like cupin family protein
MEPVIRNVRDARVRTVPPVPPEWWKYYMPGRTPESHSRVLIGVADGDPDFHLGYREYPAGFGGRGQMHSHPWEHIEFILEGELTLVCDGKEYKVVEGDAVYIKAGTSHDLFNRSSARARRLVINPRWSRGLVGG